MKFFFTVDVEIWLGGSKNLDERFPDAFKTFIYGTKRSGDLGLPLKLKILNDHGLKGVFFVEALFATRFGKEPLAEIVGLIHEAGHEVQMHVHTEWVDEVEDLLHLGRSGNRQNLYMFTREEQTELIAIAKDLLADCGAARINTFRAGNFGMNADTVKALADNGIMCDTSYNHTHLGPDNRMSNGPILVQPRQYDGVHEYPMTVYEDRAGHFRHFQLGACSYPETESVMRQASDAGWDNLVMLSHNFELMNQRKTRSDPIVLERFLQLARFLEKHSDEFTTQGFQELQPHCADIQPSPPRVESDAVMLRHREQLKRWIYL